MLFLAPTAISGFSYAPGLFGANVLATRDYLGEDGSIGETLSYLGVSAVRYPGGSLTEYWFDISDPNRDLAINPTTGADQPLMPYSDILGWSQDTGAGLTIVLPTRLSLGTDTDSNGDRFAEIDEAALRAFVQNSLTGAWGNGNITAFEIGNEYWHSGEMTSVEYGRVASEMAVILRDEINGLPGEAPAILVQSGANYGSARLSATYSRLESTEAVLNALNADYGLNFDSGYVYSSGEIAWARVANALILNEFDTEEEINSVDGVVVHLYTRGADQPNSRYFDLNTVRATWGETIPDIEIHVTEWNQKSGTAALDPRSDYGLLQALEMLNITEAMVAAGVQNAHVWGTEQTTHGCLFFEESANDPHLHVPGAMFMLMSESLPGTRPVHFGNPQGREHELLTDTAAVHGFVADDRFVAFVASRSDAAQDLIVDFGQMVTDPGTLRITRLGVEEGNNPGCARAHPVVTEEDPDSLYDEGFLSVSLAPHEILRIEMVAPEFSADFARMTGISQDTPPADLIVIPDINGDDSVGIVDEDDDNPTEGVDNSAFGMDLDMLLMAILLIPLMAFAAF